MLDQLQDQLHQKEAELKSFHQQKDHATETVQKMLKDNPNLQFEVNSGKYKFDEIDPNKIEHKLAELNEKHEDLKKKVNVNIELMFEKTSKWHEELLRKRTTL